MGYYDGVVVGEDKEWSACGLVMGSVRVRWSWLSDPRVDVSLSVRGNGTHWKIRHPEVAPPGARYELVVDEGPGLLLPSRGR
jgi:hypothetical protein